MREKKFSKLKGLVIGLSLSAISRMAEARPVTNACIDTTSWLGFTDEWRIDDKVLTINENTMNTAFMNNLLKDPAEGRVGRIDDNMSELGDM